MLEDQLLAALTHTLDRLEALAAAGESPLSDAIGAQLRRAARLDEERRRRTRGPSPCSSPFGSSTGRARTDGRAPASAPERHTPEDGETGAQASSAAVDESSHGDDGMARRQKVATSASACVQADGGAGGPQDDDGGARGSTLTGDIEEVDPHTQRQQLLGSPSPGAYEALNLPPPAAAPRTPSAQRTPSLADPASPTTSLDAGSAYSRRTSTSPTRFTASSSSSHLSTRRRHDRRTTLDSGELSSSSSSSSDDDDQRDEAYVAQKDCARWGSEERDWDEEDEIEQAREELVELDEDRERASSTRKRRSTVEDDLHDGTKKRSKNVPGLNLRRLIRNPADGLLLPNSPLAVFGSHLYLLALPSFQRELGALIHDLLNPSSTIDPALGRSRALPEGLADYFADDSSATEVPEAAFVTVVGRLGRVERRSVREDWERVLASIELAALVAGMEARSAQGSRLERLQQLAVSHHLELDVEECLRSVSEGHMWARWLCIGGVPLVLVLVVLLRHPPALGTKLTFRDVVLRRSRNGALVGEFEPDQHPYPLAAPAFRLLLRPTLATIAAFDPVRVDFLHHSQVVLSGEPVSQAHAKRGVTPYFWKHPQQQTQTRLSPAPKGSVAALVKSACSNRVLGKTRPLQVVLGRFDPPATRPEAFDPTANPRVAPAATPADLLLRTCPGRPSELALSISGQPDVPSLVSFYHDNAVKEVDEIDARLPRVTIDAPSAIDLSPENLGLKPPPPTSAAARAWSMHRPTSFFSPGHEQVDRRAGWNDASEAVAAQMERERGASTKATLLRRMEALAGGRAALMHGVSRAVAGAPSITSKSELEARLKDGWRLGVEMTTLAVADAIVEIKSDVEGAPPLLAAYPPDTIPPYIQQLYDRANSILYPPELSHHLGMLCCDSSCSSCPAGGTREEDEEGEGPERIYFAPRAHAARPCASVPAELLGVPVDALDIVERSAGKSAQKPPSAKSRRSNGEEAWADGACVVRLAAGERQGVFAAWNLCSWPGTKYGELREEVDEETGMKVVGGSGPGNGALWRDQVWTTTLGYAADAAAAQLQPLWALQRELVRRHQPAIYDKLVTNLANFDKDGDGEPQWPAPWAGYHANAGGASASMAVHTDDDALEAAAAIASFGEYTGGEVTLIEMLAAVQGGRGSLNLLASDRVLHGVARVRSGRRLTSDSSQSRAFAVDP